MKEITSHKKDSRKLPINHNLSTKNSVADISHPEQIRVEGYNRVYILYRLEDTHPKLLSLFSNYLFIILQKVPVNRNKKSKLGSTPHENWLLKVQTHTER